MKHTKYFIIPLFIFSVFISSCSKDDLLIENNDSALNAGKKGSKANSFYEESLPKIKFIPNKKNKNTYSIKITDPNQTAPEKIGLRIRNATQNQWIIDELQCKVINPDENGPIVVVFKNIDFKTGVEDQILDIYMEYREGDVVVKTFEYSLFVFADGTTALQKPEVSITKKGLVGSWSFDDSHGTDNSNATFSVIVENDPAEVVTAVEVLFDEKTSSPAPKSYTNYLKTKSVVKYGQCWVFSSVIPFSENPEGSLFTLQIVLLDASGNEISLLENAVTICLKPGPGNGPAHIHDVRIKEINNGSEKPTYEIAALVLNVKQERLGYVEIKFNELFDGPKPVNTTLQLRDRLEIVYQEWEAIIKKNPSYISPLYDSKGMDVQSALYGAKSAIGYNYTVTATIFDKNEKQIGKPQTFNVTIEGETDNTEPEVLSTRIFSADKGLSWTLEVKAADKGAWVEKVQVEFVKPFSVAIPLTNPLSLTYSKEEPGNIETYTFTNLKFEGEPTLSEFPIKIQFSNGSGTKNASSQVSARPQLL